MFAFLEDENFSTNRGKLNVGIRGSLTLVMFSMRGCEACSRNRSILETLSQQFQELSFAIADVDICRETVATLAASGIPITHTPSFVLFKLGVFSEKLDVSFMDRETLIRLLAPELGESATRPIPLDMGF